LGFDPATQATAALVAVYLGVALAGVLAFVHGVRFARVALGVAVLAGVVMLQTAVFRSPMLVPFALLGLGLTIMAGLSISKSRAGR
jgi:hypothetical protein